MSNVLRWEAPPERPTDRWTKVADELKEHTGEWGVVAENQKNNTLARNIKQAVYKSFEPAGTFETRSVKVGETFTIFARFTNGEANMPQVRKSTTRTRASRKGTSTKKTTTPEAKSEQPQAVTDGA